jgi:hypothetical protein
MSGTRITTNKNTKDHAKLQAASKESKLEVSPNKGSTASRGEGCCYRKQRTENRKRKTENGKQRTENRKQRTENSVSS